MPKRKERVNLNDQLTGRKRQRVCGDIKVHFDNIIPSLCRNIRRKDTHYIMGCSAWFTNSSIIKTMASHLSGCCIIVTKDKILRAKTTKAKYKMLPKNNGKSPIQVIGSGRGYNKSLMHHKYLVGLDKEGDPVWVSLGSSNMTQSTTSHLESVMIINNKEVAQIYLDEFLRLYKISKSLVL